MNCGKIRGHLSEYIDESLEATTKALVEEHLSACEDCQKEVALLRMLIEDLGSMETVAPPKDFLDQLHKRMEGRSWVSKALDTLSIPMRAKLPMKVAGAVVMAVLAITIFQIQKDQYGTRMIPSAELPIRSESYPPKTAEAPLGPGAPEEAYSSGAVRQKAKPTPQAAKAVVQKDKAEPLPQNGVKEIAQVETKAYEPSRKGAQSDLSLRKMTPLVQESTQLESSSPKMAKASLKTGARKEADTAEVGWERMKPKLQTSVQTVAQKDEAISLPDSVVKRIAHVETKAYHPSRKEIPIVLSLVIESVQPTDSLGATLDMEAPQARETKMRRRLAMEEAVPTTQLERNRSIENLVPRLREVMERAGGEVISVEYEGETRVPESVLVEIPAKQIGLFQNNLQALGELHGPPIGPRREDEEVLTIRIRLLTP